MKKIGLIDYYLDQYHAVNYPTWIKDASQGRMEVTYAYAMIDKPDGKTNKDFCREMGIELLSSIEEVIDKSDCLIVMSPDHSEFHEELCRLPLASGKPVYVDKTFAPDRASARRMISIARDSKTPFFSSSALRFTSEYRELDKRGIEAIHSRGPGSFDTYAIHQLEPIIALMGHKVEKIMYVGTKNTPALVLRFADGRLASMAQLGWECDFSLALNYQDDRAVVLQGASDFYKNFIDELVAFFDDSLPRVPAEETLQIMTILEYGQNALNTPDVWIELPADI